MCSHAFVTVVTENYLPLAHAALDSVRAHHPNTDTWIVVAERDDAVSTRLAPGRHRLLAASRLATPHWPRWSFQYAPFELACALKPWAISGLLERGYRRVVYLDADTYLYRPLDMVFECLATKPIALTAHHPTLAVDHPRTVQKFADVGQFNAGLLGVRDSFGAREFLTWWSHKLVTECIVNLSAGRFVDQRWLDEAPERFPDTIVLPHPGINAGHWSLDNWRFTLDAGHVTMHGRSGEAWPLVLFHWSQLLTSTVGFHGDLKAIQLMSHSPAMIALWRHYLDTLGRYRVAESVRRPASVTMTDTGVPIDAVWREAIRRNDARFASVERPAGFRDSPDLHARFRSIEQDRSLEREDWRHRRAKESGVRGIIRGLTSWLRDRRCRSRLNQLLRSLEA